jgi:hypothetical protein
MIENINSMPLFSTLLLLTDIKFSTYRKKAIDFTLAIFTISSTNLLKRNTTNNKNKTYKKGHDIRLVHNTLNIRRLELTLKIVLALIVLVEGGTGKEINFLRSTTHLHVLPATR